MKSVWDYATNTWIVAKCIKWNKTEKVEEIKSLHNNTNIGFPQR